MILSKILRSPINVILLSLAIGGCNTTASNTDAAPLVTFLHSEFKTIDGDTSFFGPFMAATQAQQNSNNLVSAHFYMQALKADPSSRFVADRAFFQLLVSGRVDDAAALATKLSREVDTSQDDLVRLMYALEAYKKGDWPEVRERLGTDGISTGFGYILAPLLTAWSYGAEGDIKAAQLALSALALNKRLKPLAAEHLAYILDYVGLNDEAAAQYKSILAEGGQLSLQPSIAYAHLLYRTGKQQEARDYLGDLAVKYKNPSFLLREGDRIMHGLAPTQQVTTPKGAAGLVFFRLATEFARGSSPQAGVIYFRIATYLTPEVTDIYFLLSDLLEKMGNTDGAAAALKAVPKTSRLHKLAIMRRIEVLRAGSRLEEAEELLRFALLEDPKDFETLVGLADLLQQREMFIESIQYYDQAIAQIRKPMRRDWYVFFARGLSHERTKNWAQAEKDLLVALSVSPEEPNVLNYLGYSWIDRGQKIEEAKKMIERAVKALPDDGFIVDSLGWVYFLTGDYAGAVTELERAVRLEPTDATINDHLGDAYWKVGREIEARFQWQHALDGSLEDDKREAVRQKIDIGLKNLPIKKTIS